MGLMRRSQCYPDPRNQGSNSCPFLQLKKKWAEVIINSLGDEISMPKVKKVKTSGMRLVAGPVSIEVGQSQGSSANILAAIQQQNDYLWQLVDHQQLLVDAALHQAMLRGPLVQYLG
jgi:hypothetical protein